MMQNSYYQLSAEQLSRLFLQLSQMENAGIPASKAFCLVENNNTAFRKRITQLQTRLQAGESIAEAGFDAGLFNDHQQTLIHAGEISGRLAEVYRKLAFHYNSLALRIKKIKARLIVPALTLVLALFVQPLPALVSEEISIGQYVAQSLGVMLMIVLVVFVCQKLPDILNRLGWLTLFHPLQLSLPIVDNWLINRQLNEFFFILAMMLDAGISFSEALPKAVNSINNTLLRQRFNTALAVMKTGASVASTLALAKDIKPVTLQIINSGEQSGKLAENLLHFNKIDAETITLQDETFAEWLPRVVYGLITAWLAYGLLPTNPQ